MLRQNKESYDSIPPSSEPPSTSNSSPYSPSYNKNKSGQSNPVPDETVRVGDDESFWDQILRSIQCAVNFLFRGSSSFSDDEGNESNSDNEGAQPEPDSPRRRKHQHNKQRKRRPSCGDEMAREIRRKSIILKTTKARKDAVLKFNTKPKLAIEYLREHANMTNLCSPEDFSGWLYEWIEKLSKKKIGEFLGGAGEYEKEALRCFLGYHDFTDLSIDGGLRQLLKTFRLPGEAQVIDRILEAFATRFATCNPNKYSSTDCIYILSFSIIMLNTDLHSSSIPEHKKMTLEEFVRNNRGIDDGNDPPRALLEEIFENIKRDEIIMKEADMWESDVVTFIAPHKAGYLQKKRDGKVHSWKKHWFVLADSCLYYFTNPSDENPRCIIPLDNVRVGRGYKSCDILLTSADGTKIKSAKNLDNGSMEVGDRKEYVLRAETEIEREAWVKILQTNLDRNPVHRAMRQKREEEGDGRDADKTPIELPPPAAEGWMKKRGDFNSGWRLRYFCVFVKNGETGSETAGKIESNKTMLYYYGSKEMAQRMIDLGEETHKGCLDLAQVSELNVETNRGCNSSDNEIVVALNLVTSTRKWQFSECDRPKAESSSYPDGYTSLNDWVEIFKKVCPEIRCGEATQVGENREEIKLTGGEVCRDGEQHRGYSL